MKIKVCVAGVTKEVCFRGSRDERQVTVLNCLDSEACEGLKLKQTFDYVPTKEVSPKVSPIRAFRQQIKRCRPQFSLLSLS
jgi:hypothetical protein